MTADPGAPPAAAAPTSTSLARSTAVMTVLTLVSRATGLVRIVLVGAVVGTTFLGNTYESTNTIPNVVFELMAAGTFQAVLIPTLVRLMDRGRQEEAEHIAASVFGVALVALFGVALVGMAFAHQIATVLFSGSDEAVRADQIRLGSIFLLIFLPQVGMYATGMVATGVLNAQHRFAVPAIAPAVNNVIVCTAYGLFWWSRHGAEPSLDLTGLQIALLAGGTTAGVVGFSLLPLLAVRRTPFHLRVAFDRRHPEVTRILKMGVWAAGFLASTQLLILVEILLANRIKGGVVALQIGWTFFLLPYALFAQPVLTALFPTMSRQVAHEDHEGYARSVERGTEMICLFVIPAAISFVAVAPALCRAILFGAIDSEGAAEVARVVTAFAPGVVGYGLLLFYARALYARDDARTPTIVNLAAGVAGGIAMVALFPLASTRWQVPVLAAVHALAYSAGAVVVARIVARRLPTSARPHLLRRLRPQLRAWCRV
ncbi:MAG: murein biosynthesis integral membrane protein MurJ, partial [Actinobacteria bacterium]|nr:murein biosynthesis integral membrane protein MurJ [Actinomycetota bacterium]